jgi:hypothetical protein
MFAQTHTGKFIVAAVAKRLLIEVNPANGIYKIKPK